MHFHAIARALLQTREEFPSDAQLASATKLINRIQSPSWRPVVMMAGEGDIQTLEGRTLGPLAETLVHDLPVAKSNRLY